MEKVLLVNFGAIHTSSGVRFPSLLCFLGVRSVSECWRAGDGCLWRGVRCRCARSIILSSVPTGRALTYAALHPQLTPVLPPHVVQGRLTLHLQTFTHALYNLAAYTQYIEPLREEVEEVVAAEGWSKASLGKMRKLDSFLKESMRLADGALRASLLPTPRSSATTCSLTLPQ